MLYLKVGRVFEKLRKAEEQFRPVIILASTGFGKTTAVNLYYERRSILTITGRTGSFDRMPPIPEIRQGVVFADDISFLTDDRSKRYLCDLITDGSKQVVAAGRGKFPVWLTRAAFEKDILHITEEDLRFGTEQTTEMLAQLGAVVSGRTAEQLTEVSKGYPPAVGMFAYHIAAGGQLDQAMIDRVWEEMVGYWEENVLSNIDRCIYEMMLSLAGFESFTAEFAEFITGSKKTRSWIEYLENASQILERTPEGEFCFRSEPRRMLLKKQQSLLTEEQKKEIFRRAAYYYEKMDDTCAALKYYSLAQANEQIKNLLIQNSERHPGTGHYYETREYYYALPRKIILEEPALMSGMSMLCSLVLDPEGSENWYRQLDLYQADTHNPKAQRRYARSCLVYLDIALPHRAGKGMLGILKNTFKLMRDGEVTLPEFSVTSNIPSVMNGGKDFCAWSKNDRQIAKFMSKPITVVMGAHGRGIVNIALAESGFEKGTMEPYEVVTRLNNGISDADNGGKLEMVFAASGLLVKQHLTEGQWPTANRRVESFKKRMLAEKAVQMYANFEAFEAWFSLYSGDTAKVQEYLKKAPNEQLDFYILDRYRYMVKLRCLIAEGMLAEAFELSSYLTGYYKSYGRTYLTIENNMLKAMIMYRSGSEVWRELLISALTAAAEYHFVRVFSLEGAAMLPMLRNLGENDLPQEFFQTVLNETSRTALHYPDYLKHIQSESIKLTDRETEILGMLCAGMTTDEICGECGISYSGLKKHNRNIYQKLGVKNRAEAERTALQLGIIHRKER